MILSWSFSARALPKPWNFSQEKRELPRRRTPRNSDCRPAAQTTEQRGTTSQPPAAIDEDVTGFFFASGDIYEDAAHHNAVFVGGTRTEYRATPTARERRETSCLM